MEPTENPGAVLREAVALMRQGRYEESLQKHLWFHDHALDFVPAMAGVRLSFALGYWVELGESYPEAMLALTAVRDWKAKSLADGEGSFELFHDVTAINGCLHDEPETAALFKVLHEAYPELAARCYPIAEQFLVAEQEYEVCAAYLPDPMARFEEIRQLRQIQLEIAGENPAIGTPEFRDYADGQFAAALGRLVAILVHSGSRREAERVGDLSLAECPGALVREALGAAIACQDPEE